MVITTTQIEWPPVLNDHFKPSRQFLLLFVIELSDHQVLATNDHVFDQNFAF